ncbi:hypothetical protein [Allomuricauda sp. F6463D]|uniref:hypothetical protein n=1 Tax=Allomuricauda sp. F6463D TaxID=2926409 RepID=UPI001FF5CA04|nr:hypothetical protein [Muricauda sp. F6463D]MCK0159887.1 hypothetical protein [Muricauda sp. F6463D]
MKADQVIRDCIFCKNELKDALETNNSQKIRVNWITCLTLLRMVGHVLEKVDKKNYPSSQIVFSSLWNEKKVDDVFLNFIEKERNEAIKEYKFSFKEDNFQVETDNEFLFQNGNSFLSQSGERMVFMDKKRAIHFASKTKQITIVEEERLDLWVENAIEWWTDYLKELKFRLNESQNP